MMSGFSPNLLMWFATLVLTGFLAMIAVVDARSFRIPDVLSLPLIGLGLLWTATQPEASLLASLIGAAVGYGVLAVIGEVYFRRNGTEGLGLGDAKLFAAAGAWLGWQALPQVLLIGSLAGLIFALFSRRLNAGSRKMAFGPWLAFGLWVVWIWQRVMQMTP